MAATVRTPAPVPAPAPDPAPDWDSAALDLERYLARVGLARRSGTLVPDHHTLRAVHRAHVAAIPFENLEIVLGRPVPLDIASLQRKLVDQQRGGYCYEQNVLLAAALDRLGFRVEGFSARIRVGDDRIRPTSHALLHVTDDDGAEWIADVGFGGGGLLEPIPFAPGTEMRQGRWTFRLDRVDAAGAAQWVLRSLHPDGPQDMYAFTAQPQYPVDYAVYNHYTSTHPRSPFTRGPMVQHTRPDLRRALRGTALSETRPDEEPRTREVDPADIPGILRDTFGIELDPADEAAVVHSAEQAADQ
ncbi:N-hydroxyarylamine O-acetyltransferase [Murinocardiopsis flavida]|uniref:N-hydroxyarylamine O-acetyltransferase n=1 Tax=Murinocardiopsis flavida TaxID=645275 RepID=A0A2P8D6F9_9ACTN|nr:arylamine N-acetyltransferase [Murinocardiopsis flavida]PSK92804.1 N-hydroxyarylamine O-acetyltransferase [Murinocardiopsis flavida]